MIDTEVLLGHVIEVAEKPDWDAFYEEQLPRVYNFFLYKIGDGMLAEDLTALTFEKAWRNRHTYDSDVGAFENWLFGIARNVAIDIYRRQELQVIELDAALCDVVAVPTSIEETIQQTPNVNQLHRILGRLSSSEQELVALKYGAGMTNRAIARLMHKSETNIGTILYRIVRKLRARWVDES